MGIIYAIPGLGTTKELFENISVAGHELKVLDWPAPQKNYTLSDYANEFLKQMDTARAVNLMGVSFGGMLCSELSQKIKTNKVVLISSCKNRLEFPSLLKFLRIIPLHKLISEARFRRMAKHGHHVLGFEKALVPLFFNMVNSMQPDYFSCCVNYIVQWSRTGDNPALVRIHGTADRLLTPTRIKGGYIIKGGSHAMVLNKAEEINTILNKEFNGL